MTPAIARDVAGATPDAVKPPTAVEPPKPEAKPKPDAPAMTKAFSADAAVQGAAARYEETATQREAARKSFDTAHPAPQKPNMQPWSQKMPEHDPVRAFGSWASVFGVLVGAMARAPLATSLNASASAMEAMRRGDLATYEDAKKTWKDNSEMAVKNAEWEWKAYQDAWGKFDKNWGEREADVKTVAALANNAAMLKISGAQAADSHITAGLQQTINARKIIDDESRRMDAQARGVQDYNEERAKNPTLPALDAMAPTQRGPLLQRLTAHGERLLDREDKLAVAGTSVPKAYMIDDKLQYLTGPQLLALQQTNPDADIQPYRAPGAAERGVAERLGIAGSEIAAHLKNLSELPKDTTVGLLPTLTDTGSLANFLRNKAIRAATPLETHVMNQAFAGIGRNLAVLEAAGVATGVVGLSQQMAQTETIRPGDDSFVVAAKMANIRQIAEKALETKIKGGTLTPGQKKVAEEIIEKLHEAVPFDLGQFITAAKAAGKFGKNEQTALGVVQKSLGLPSEAREPGPSPEAPGAPAASRIIPTKPMNRTNAQLMEDAREVIKKGADAEAVKRQLREWGVPTKGL
jgi:hypothetical protein